MEILKYGVRQLLSLSTTEILLASVVFVASYLFISFLNNKKRNLPPGPIGYPIVGCLPHIKKDPYVVLNKMADKYGDVYCMYLGSRLVLVLNGVDACREGMNKVEFSGRPPHGPFTLGGDIPSVVSISGKEHTEQRRFMLHTMRDLGFGKTVMEECMKVEIEYFLNALEDTKGKPFEARTIISPSVSNNITALVYGERYDYEDSRRKLLDDTRHTIQKYLGQTAIHTFLPWVEHIPFIKNYFGYDKIEVDFKRSLNFAQEQIAKHKKTLDSNNARDYIDNYLLEMEETKKKKVPEMSFTDMMLIGNAGTLMGAGSETVTTTLGWCFYLMASFPEIQKKVQDEIDAVVGSDRMPAWADQKHMPYTQAVIMEIMRWKTIIPINLLRYTFEDTTFRGYHIPKDTIILANIWSAHYDPRHWKEPEEFKPDRFLSKDKKSVVKSDAYMPFAIGRRACPGETMAVVEVFIYFTVILQRFQIQLPKGDIPDLEGVLTISLQPKEHKLCFISRGPSH